MSLPRSGEARWLPRFREAGPRGSGNRNSWDSVRIRCRGFALTILALSACSGGGGGGSPAPETMDSPSTSQAQDIAITPAPVAAKTPPANATPSPSQTQSTQSTTTQTQRFTTFTDLNIKLRSQSGRTANMTMTMVPENGSWGNISFDVVPYYAGKICCTSVHQPFIFVGFNCFRRYSGEVDITFIVTQLSGAPTLRKLVEFTCT